jgi:hypothetical protein
MDDFIDPGLESGEVNQVAYAKYKSASTDLVRTSNKKHIPNKLTLHQRPAFLAATMMIKTLCRA